MSDVLLEARAVTKGYRTGAGYIPVLKDLDLELRQGEMIAVTGASGVGKSTLLHVLGTLDRPESGRVSVGGEDVLRYDEANLRRFRNRTLGFVFQFHHLLPEFSALENVMLPALIARHPYKLAQARALELLTALDLGARASHRPAALSGGEQQRVAVARALVQSPRALLADEPSGNLDRQTGEKLHALLRRLNTEQGISMIIVTHNEALAAICDRVYSLAEGGLHCVTAGPALFVNPPTAT